MLHSCVSYIGIGLRGARISERSIIAPFLQRWRNERIGGEEDNQDHEANTDVEQGVFSWALEFLFSSLLSHTVFPLIIWVASSAESKPSEIAWESCSLFSGSS